MIESIGWLGGACFAVCGLPQALTCIRQGHSEGINGGFLTLWILGEVLTITYVLAGLGLVWPLILNYALNLVFVTVIAFYKLFPRPE